MGEFFGMVLLFVVNFRRIFVIFSYLLDFRLFCNVLIIGLFICGVGNGNKGGIFKILLNEFWLVVKRVGKYVSINEIEFFVEGLGVF